jgi:hypothetical protein
MKKKRRGVALDQFEVAELPPSATGGGSDTPGRPVCG